MRRLKVIQMLPALETGGVERGTVELGRHLVAQGHDSLVIAAPGRMAATLIREGSRHLPWPVGRKHPGVIPWIWRVRRLLREEQPDILHLRSRLPAWIGYLAWRGIPTASRPHLVTTVHGPYTPNFYGAVMTRGERVIAISQAIRDYLRQHYPALPPERLRVIPRGVDRTEYPFGYRPPAAWLADWQTTYPHLTGQILITLPGRLTRWKGQEDFIDIIGRLRQQGLPVHGLMVGEAHPRKRHYRLELAAQIHQAGLAEAITLTGDRRDLREILAISDLVVSLSLEMEAFGRTTLEALSLGRPVAGYANGGVAEQLRELLPAGIVPLGDREAMAQRLGDWCQNPPRVPESHPFTLERMLNDTVAVYRELTDG